MPMVQVGIGGEGSAGDGREWKIERISRMVVSALCGALGWVVWFPFPPTSHPLQFTTERRNGEVEIGGIAPGGPG